MKSASSIYYEDLTDNFAVAPSKIAGTIPQAGAGLVLPLIVKRNSKGKIYTGPGNPFFAQYMGDLHITPASAAILDFTLNFIHHTGDIPEANIATFTIPRLKTRTVVAATPFSLDMTGYSAVGIVGRDQYNGIIPIEANLTITARSVVNNQRTAVNYTDLWFSQARAYYYQLQRDYPRARFGDDPYATGEKVME